MVIFKKVNVTKASDYDPLIVRELEKYGQDVIVGVFSTYTHSWFACGPQLYIINHTDGSLRSSWTFGEENNEHTDITCATELPMEDCSIPLLILGVCSETSNQISFFNPNTRNVLRTININYPVRTVCVVEDGLSEVNPINNTLTRTEGLLAVGSADGTLLIVDLCRSLLIEGMNRGYGSKRSGGEPAELKLISASELTEEVVGSKLADCYRRGDCLALPLYNDDVEGVTALLYSRESASLYVGTSTGSIHIWNLSSLACLYSSASSAGGPVTSLCLLEPVDDPRHNLYLWVCHEGPPPVAFMHCLVYSSKFNVPEYGVYYQGFEAANIVYKLRPGSESGRSAEATRIIACQAVAKTVPKSLIRAIGGVTEAESSQLRLMGLTYETREGDVTGSRLVVFDLNQWYREQMPEEASPRTGCLETVDLTEGGGLHALALIPSSLTHYQWLKPLEQHFQPSSFSFVMWMLEEKGVRCLEKLGLQSVWLRNMAACGGGSLLDPSPLFKGSLAAGLIPTFFEPPDPYTASKEEERSYVLTICLENRVLSVMESAADAWAPGIHSVSGCTLDYLLSWMWQLHTIYKSHAYKICTPLFDQSGLEFDISERRTLQHCKSLLNTVETVYRRIVRKNSAFIINKDCDMKLSAMSLIRFYVECCLKFASLSILPEPNENGRPRNSLIYKYDQLEVIISNRRGRCSMLCDTLIESSSVLLCWEEEGGAPQYPPPSVQSLLRLCLHPGLDSHLKLSLMMYFYMDLLHISSDTFQADELFMNEKVANFQHLLGISDVQHQIVVGFWKLDHCLIEEGMRLILDGRVETSLLTESQHRTILKVLTTEKQHKLALQYLRFKAPPLYQPSDLKLELDLLLANQLTYEAFLFQRKHQHIGDVLLEQFFKGASERSQLTPVFGFNMEPVEEAAFMTFLKKSNLQNGGDLQVLLLLSKARYNEAICLNDKLNRSMMEPKRRQERQTRDMIVRRVTSSVCPLGRDLEREIRNYKPVHQGTGAGLKPLSVFVKIRRERDGPLFEADPRRMLSAVAREARHLHDFISSEKTQHINGILPRGKKRILDWEEMEVDLVREPVCKKARELRPEVTPPRRKTGPRTAESQVMELVGTPLVRREGTRHLPTTLTHTHSILKSKTPDKVALNEDLTETPKKTLRFSLPENQGRVSGRKSLHERSRTGCLFEEVAKPEAEATPTPATVAGDVTPTTGHNDSIRERLRSSTKKKLISEEEGSVDWNGVAETIQPRVLFSVGSSTPTKKTARPVCRTPLSRNIPSDVSLSSSECEMMDAINRDSDLSPLTEAILHTTTFKTSSTKEPDREETIVDRYKRQKVGVETTIKEEDLIPLEVKETSARNVYVIKALQNSVKEMRRKMEETTVLGEKEKEEEMELWKYDSEEETPKPQIEEENQLVNKDRGLSSEEDVTGDGYEESDLEPRGSRNYCQDVSEDENVEVEQVEDLCRLPQNSSRSFKQDNKIEPTEEDKGVCVMISSSDEEVDIEENKTQRNTGNNDNVEDCLELENAAEEEETIVEEKSVPQNKSVEGKVTIPTAYLIKGKKSEENVSSKVSERSRAMLETGKNCMLGQTLRDGATPTICPEEVPHKDEDNYDFLVYQELPEGIQNEGAEGSNSESCLYENLVDDFQEPVDVTFQHGPGSNFEISIIKHSTGNPEFFGKNESENSNDRGSIPEVDEIVTYAEVEQTEIFPRVMSGRRRRSEDLCESSSDSEEDPLGCYGGEDTGSSESNENGGSHVGHFKQGRGREDEIICLDSETEESSEEGVITELDGEEEEETELMTENEDEEPEEMSGNDEEFEQTTEEDENEEEEEDYAISDDDDLIEIPRSQAVSTSEADNMSASLKESTKHREGNQKRESGKQKSEDIKTRNDTFETADVDIDKKEDIAEEDDNENLEENLGTLENRIPSEEIEAVNSIKESDKMEYIAEKVDDENLKENLGKLEKSDKMEDIAEENKKLKGNLGKLENRPLSEEVEAVNSIKELGQQDYLGGDLKGNERKSSIETTEVISDHVIEETVEDNFIVINKVMSLGDFEEDVEYESQQDTEEAISGVSLRQEGEKTTIPDEEDNQGFGLATIEEGGVQYYSDVTREGMNEDTVQLGEEKTQNVAVVKEFQEVQNFTSSEEDNKENPKKLITLGVDKEASVEVGEEKPVEEMVVSDSKEIGNVELQEEQVIEERQQGLTEDTIQEVVVSDSKEIGNVDLQEEQVIEGRQRGLTEDTIQEMVVSKEIGNVELQEEQVIERRQQGLTEDTIQEMVVSDSKEIGNVELKEEQVIERRQQGLTEDTIQEVGGGDVPEIGNVTIEVQYESLSDLKEESSVIFRETDEDRKENDVSEVEALKLPGVYLIEQEELSKESNEQENNEVGTEVKQDSGVPEEKSEKKAVVEEVLHKTQTYLTGDIEEKPEVVLTHVNEIDGDKGSKEASVAEDIQVTDYREKNQKELVVQEVSSGMVEEFGALQDETRNEQELVPVIIKQPEEDKNEEREGEKMEEVEILEIEVVPRNVEGKSPNLVKEENLQEEIVDGNRKDDLKELIQISQIVKQVVDKSIHVEDVSPETVLKVENKIVHDEILTEQKENEARSKDVREKREEMCIEKTFDQDNNINMNAKSFFFGHQDNGSYLRTSLATFSVGSRLSLPEEDESVDLMEVAMIQDSEEGSNEVQEDTGNTVINLSPPHLSPEDDESKNVNSAAVIFSKEKEEEEEDEVRNRIMPSLSPQRSPVEDRTEECTEGVGEHSPVKAVEDEEEDDPQNMGMLDFSLAPSPEDHKTQDKSILTIGSYLQRKALKKELKKASLGIDRVQSSSLDGKSSVSSQTTVLGSKVDEAALDEPKYSKTSVGPELKLKSILKKETMLTAERERSVDKETVNTEEQSDRRRSSRSVDRTRRGSSVVKELVPETRGSSQDLDLRGILKNKEREDSSVKTTRSRRSSQESEAKRETKDHKTKKASLGSHLSENPHDLRSLQKETSHGEYKRPRASSLEPKGILKNKDRESSATFHLREDPSDVKIRLGEEAISARHLRCSSEELLVLTKSTEELKNFQQEEIASRKSTISLHAEIKLNEHDVRRSSRRRSSVSSQTSDDPQDLRTHLEEVLKDKDNRRSTRSSISSQTSEDLNDVKNRMEYKRSSRTSVERPLKGILKNTAQQKNRRSRKSSVSSQTSEDPREEEEEDKQDRCSVKSGRSSTEPSELKGILKHKDGEGKTRKSSVSCHDKKRIREVGSRCESNDPKESGRSSRNSCKNMSQQEEEKNSGSSRRCDAAKEEMSDRRSKRSLDGEDRRHRKSSCSSDTAKDLRMRSEEDFPEDKKYKRCRSYSMGSHTSEHPTDLSTCRHEEDLSDNRKRSLGQSREADEYTKKKKLRKSYSGEFLRSVDYPVENQKPRRSSELPGESRKSRRNSTSSHSSDHATDLRLRIEEEDLASLASRDHQREEINERLQEVSSEEKTRCRSNRERRSRKAAARRGGEDPEGLPRRLELDLLEDGASLSKRSRSVEDYPVKRGSRLPRPTLGAILEEEDVASPAPLTRHSSYQELRTAEWLRSQPLSSNLTPLVIANSDNVEEVWPIAEISAEGYTQERRLTRTQKKVVLRSEELQLLKLKEPPRPQGGESSSTPQTTNPRRSGRSKTGAGDSSVSSEGSSTTPVKSSKRLASLEMPSGGGTTPLKSSKRLSTIEEASTSASGDVQSPGLSTPKRRLRRLSETKDGVSTPSPTPTRSSRRLQKKPPSQHNYS